MYPLLGQQPFGLVFLVSVGIVHCYGVASEFLDQSHARYVRGSVSEIDHPRERHWPVFLQDEPVDQSMVPDAHHALVDLEQELCLCRVVHCDSRPDRLPVLVQEGAGEHFLAFP